jgi:hypothetical protein
MKKPKQRLPMGVVLKLRKHQIITDKKKEDLKKLCRKPIKIS